MEKYCTVASYEDLKSSNSNDVHYTLLFIGKYDMILIKVSNGNTNNNISIFRTASALHARGQKYKNV